MTHQILGSCIIHKGLYQGNLTISLWHEVKMGRGQKEKNKQIGNGEKDRERDKDRGKD